MSIKVYEQEKLNLVLNYLEKKLNHVRFESNGTRKRSVVLNKEMYEGASNDFGDIDVRAEMSQHLSTYSNNQKILAANNKKFNQLTRMIEKPYFGRIDFNENHSTEKEKLYIGIGNVFDDDTLEILIYDWRAPISNVYYEDKYGTVSYNSPDGLITGDISLKRQFNISKGEILDYYDSSNSAADPLLIKILSSKSNSKMTQIAETIQLKQNEIIRAKDYDLLFVQGVPGSGKSIIAMHRIAYLMYHSIKTYSHSNILILSPNDIFSQYIENVLPELGEEAVKQLTYKEIFPNNISIKNSILLTEKELELKEFKGSKNFYNVLKKWFKYYLSNIHEYSDVYYNNVVISSRHEIKNKIINNFSNKTINVICEKIRLRAYSKINESKKTLLEKAKKATIIHMNHPLSSEAYSRLLAYKRFKTAKVALDNNLDICPYKIYDSLKKNEQILKTLFNSIDIPENLFFNDDINDIYAINLISTWIKSNNALSKFKHVVVDESQDYNYLQYSTFKLLFKNAKFTILGDLNQSIYNKANSNLLTNINEIFSPNTSKVIELNQCYRSTREITTYANQFINKQTKAVERNGEQIITREFESKKDIINNTITDIKKYLHSKLQSIACIVHTSEEATDLYNKLKLHFDISIIEDDSKLTLSGIFIVPIHLAKGLEFDGVIYLQSKANKSLINQLAYVASTRAMHKLSVIKCN